MSSQIMDGLKAQYMTYPWQVIVPFGKLVKGEIVKVESIDERGDTFVAKLSTGDIIKMSYFDKALKIHDVNNNVGTPEPLSDKPLIDTNKAEFKDIKPETKPGQFPMRSVDLHNNNQINNVRQQTTNSSYFNKFNSKERKLELELKIKLPSISLLKAMYKDASDQVEFTKELSSYIHSNITSDLIDNSVVALLKNNKQ